MEASLGNHEKRLQGAQSPEDVAVVVVNLAFLKRTVRQSDTTGNDIPLSNIIRTFLCHISPGEAHNGHSIQHRQRLQEPEGRGRSTCPSERVGWSVLQHHEDSTNHGPSAAGDRTQLQHQVRVIATVAARLCIQLNY